MENYCNLKCPNCGHKPSNIKAFVKESGEDSKDYCCCEGCDYHFIIENIAITNSYFEIHLLSKEEMNTATKEGGERFPFELGETDAKRIINIACGEWQQKLAKMWGYELLIDSSVEITEGFYKEMRNACTPSQNLLFDEIFGEDEKGYQVGDCVITEGYSDVYDGRVLKIKEIDTNYVFFTVLDYGYFNSSDVFSIGRIKRKATEEEIEKAQIIPEGTPCLVRRQGHFLPNSYRLRYADGKGGFYMNGNKKGDTGGWDVVHVLNDLNNLPELK